MTGGDGRHGRVARAGLKDKDLEGTVSGQAGPAVGKAPPFDEVGSQIATLHVAFNLDPRVGRIIAARKLDGSRRETCLYLTNGALFPEIRRFVRACFADVGTRYSASRSSVASSL